MRPQTEPLSAALRQAQRVALVSHVSPDGDTIGSALALSAALQRLGRQVSLFCADPVPAVYAPLPGAGAFRQSFSPDEAWDAVCCVDIASADRMGAMQPLLNRAPVLMQIDHHGTNPGYAQINLVDGGAPAAGLLVREVIAALGIPLDQELAVPLYAAISTDTGNFSFAGTSPETFRVAAELAATGFSLAYWNRLFFRERPAAQARLLGRALNSLTLHENGRLSVMCLRQTDFTECGALPEHSDTLVNAGLDIIGVRIALLLREAADGSVKCSLRAVAPYRVDAIAASLGGGGHQQASGLTLRGTSLPDACALLTELASRELASEAGR